MGKGLFRRMLPFSYLKKIGRYDTSVHIPDNFPGYPKRMMQELKMAAEKGEKVKLIRSLGSPYTPKAAYKHNKFISVEMGASKNRWVIPSNWTVRV